MFKDGAGHSRKSRTIPAYIRQVKSITDGDRVITPPSSVRFARDRTKILSLMITVFRTKLENQQSQWCRTATKWINLLQTIEVPKYRSLSFSPRWYHSGYPPPPTLLPEPRSVQMVLADGIDPCQLTSAPFFRNERFLLNIGQPLPGSWMAESPLAARHSTQHPAARATAVHVARCETLTELC